MADQVDAAADFLYGLPLDEFTTARNTMARELRDRGLRDEAERVKSLGKPTVAAWAVNRLSREHGAELDAFLDAAAAARDAQLSGKGDARKAIGRQRDALEALVRAARDELGGEASEATTGRIRQTLESAAVDDEAEEEVRRGRLVKELEPLGFGSLLAHAPDRPPAGRRPATEDRAAARKALREARDRLHEAEEEHRAALAEERQAHKRWQQAAGDAEQAAGKVEAAREVVESLTRR